MLRGERPLIAVNGEWLAGAEPALGLKHRYADALLRAGGLPVAVPPVGGPSDVRRLLERVDGVLFTGGDDFDMARLGLGATHPRAVPVATAKQDFDVELARATLEAELPVLGICYGMQLLALVEGGDLYQHLPEDRPGSRSHSGGVEHRVRLDPESRLGRVLHLEELTVVSRHHQAVRRLGPAWHVSARDDQELIEAIERPDLAFALGVQWHPELAPEGSPHDRIFQALVFAAATRATGRRYPPGARKVEASAP